LTMTEAISDVATIVAQSQSQPAVTVSAMLMTTGVLYKFYLPIILSNTLGP